MLLTLIRGYQRWISPFLPPHCRFYPTCSHYACDAVARHGVARGMVLAVWRVARCHPWNAGGYDPVPDPTTDGCKPPSRPNDLTS